ncbi:MAG: magnesium/cobalt transporter CorA [Caldilineaceae bacterium]|nr:magnesium/cobalt transporter CorA [Caldilineaceae bacterium]
MPSDQLLAAVKDRQCSLWIDMLDPTEAEYDLVLKQAFGFHPLAIEDATQDLHSPKLDDYGAYLFIVSHTFGIGDERMDIHTSELDVFLGANFLITLHAQPRPTIEKMWDESCHRQHGLARGPAYLLYELLDRQIDGYIPLLDRFEARLEELGDVIFRRPNDKDVVLNDLLTAKSSALRLRRILIPQRDLLGRLSANDYTAIPAEVRIYYRDVYDHLLRLSDLAESMRDLASSTIETHLAIINNRMNEIMKVLTIISTTFIPLSFLASVYGMNFEFMPELHQPWAYPLVWALFLAIVAGMLWMFRRRHWI